MTDKSIKLISLNAWGGQLFGQLMGFVRKREDGADVFCFQEIPIGKKAGFTEAHGIRENLFAELQGALQDFNGLSRHALPGKFNDEELNIPFGTAIFTRKNLEIMEHGGFETYSADGYFAKSEKRTPTGNLFYVKICADGEEYLICNVHGLILREIGKSDSADRLEQSKRIMDFLVRRKEKKILCGDFNLRPDTESIAMLGREMRNLIKEYGIESTRSELYRDMEKWKDPIADYIFVSPDVKVREFKILGDVVSDHLPLFVEFS